jgi:hypothetical protein
MLRCHPIDGIEASDFFYQSDTELKKPVATPHCLRFVPAADDLGWRLNIFPTP